MIRRTFLKTFGAAILGLTLAKTLPGISGEGTPALPKPLSEEFQIGDILTVEGRYAFNPLTREPTEHLQRFIVTDVAGSTLKLHPSAY